MNNQLIEKIITANNLPCPQFTYDNPVLDRNVAKALSKSFVKILNLSQTNSKVNNNLRLSILENIRKMCQVEPENHIKIDENLTTLLLEFYEKVYKDSTTNTESVEKSLEAFLIRNFKDKNLSSSHNSQLNPEVVQALVNLNQTGAYLEVLLNDVIHWNSTETKNIRILINDLWASDSISTMSHTAEDISIKMRPEIEKCLLEKCHTILTETNPNVEGMFISDASLKKIVKTASNLANCFQICCGVLNYLFIMTNFDTNIERFVQTFIESVRESRSSNAFSVLYPTHLSHIIVLLDIDLLKLPPSLQNIYIESTNKYLSEIKLQSINDFVMLLSHFPQWFDIYFQ